MQQLLERYFSGEVGESEKKALFAAVENSTELKNDFVQLQNIKGLMALSASNTSDPEDVQNTLNRFYNHIRTMRRRQTVRLFARYAAIVAVAVCCTFMAVRYVDGESESSYSEITVPVGQRVNITLTDGSNICLNSRSRIRIPNTFSTRNRKVYLDGEAYFEIAQTQGKPFTVETSRYNVRALGTKFNVINYSEMPMFETSLLEGSVEVLKAGHDETVMLSPNEQVRLTDNGLQKISINAEDQTLWTNGILAFDSQAFSEIIKRVELYYDVRFIVRNIKALDIVYTGKFKASDSAEQVINAIHQTNKFNYRMSLDNKIIYIQ
jgi:ferric-dicitrate binding protein FerR (iron transport regulator)